MYISKKAFSLIEVVIATWILTLTLFWVYKLIWENTKIITNSSIYTTANSLFLPFWECIKNNSWNINIGDNKTFYIWLNNCTIQTSSKTGIILDNVEYILYWSWIWNNTYDLYITTNDWIKLKEKYILN